MQDKTKKTSQQPVSKQLAEIRVSYQMHETSNNVTRIRSSKDALEIFTTIWDHEMIGYRESFVVLLLNRANRILGYRWISNGGSAGTVVDTKHIFAIAVVCNASSLILAHNHPSGNVNPSQADLDLTKKIKRGGELLDISVLDHLILTPSKEYYSFADEGVM
jgi:DNA repair protein RadC